MLTLQQIIDEADILVPNTVDLPDKINRLNEINADFFNVVKIPKIGRFVGTVGQADYTLPADVREKNIDLVECGLLQYRNLMSERVSPTDNNWSYDDSSKVLTISPAPYQNGLPGIVRYHRLATTTFLVSNLDAVPDAPEEYHGTYVPALCSFLALTQEDASKAAIYEAQYKSAWNVASQNYQK